jgi:hypothetical protein
MTRHSAITVLKAAGVEDAIETLDLYLTNSGQAVNDDEAALIQPDEDFVESILADLRENHGLPAARPWITWSIWDNKDHGYALRDAGAEDTRAKLEAFAAIDNEDGADEYGSLVLYRGGQIVATGAASDLRFKL